METGQSNFKSMVWFMGVVEDINDPESLNRVRVRCIGYHTADKTLMPTADLPWAPFLSSTAQMSSPMVNQGDWVIGFFVDGEQAQQPIVFGSMVGKPGEPANPNEGFYDPQGIHPRFPGEGTNPRHARGEAGTPDRNAVAFSKSTATSGVPAADGTKFAEPESKFDARYPANHVMETDGGHVFEMDDTPGAERVQVFHKRGSFVEFHPDGSIVHRGAQDRYHIIFNNENVYAGGNMNMSVVGAVNILAGANTNISTVGDATWTVGGNLKLDVGGNFDVAVGGTTKIASAEATQLDTSGNIDIAAGGSIGIDAAGSATLYAGGTCGVRGSAVQLQGSSITTNPPIKSGPVTVTKPTSGPTIIVPKTPIAIAKSQQGGPTVFEVYAFDDDIEKSLEEYNSVIVSNGLVPADNTPPVEGASETPPAGGENKNVKCGSIVLLDDYKKVKVSKNFTLADYTQNGTRKLRDQGGLTAADILCNIVKHAENIMEPIVAAGFRVSITSGFRTPDVKLSGGGTNNKSDHNTGRAVDFNVFGMSAYEAALKIYPIVGKISKQFFLEYNLNGGGPGWLHIAYADGAKHALPMATWSVPRIHARNKFVDLKPGQKLG